MRCPNCGKFVRSTNQCAHCGYIFNREDLREMRRNKDKITPDDVSKTEENLDEYGSKEKLDTKQEKQVDEYLDSSEDLSEEVNNDYYDYVDPYVPEEAEESVKDDQDIVYYDEPRKSNSFGRILWGIVKLILAVVIIFFAFLYGPRLIRDGMSYFSNGNKEENLSVTSSIESTEDLSEIGSVEESIVTEESNSSVENIHVNIAKYPVIDAVLTLDDTLSDITRETFELIVVDNGVETRIEDYALTIDGNNILFSFNDPTQNTISANNENPELKIKASAYNISEMIEYDTPASNIDAEGRDAFNEVITSLSGPNRQIVSYFADIKDETQRYIYDNQTVDASTLISWFVLERVFEQVEAEEIAFEQEVTIKEALVADGDTGIVSNAVGEVVELQDLLYLMIQERDISAINHLIQETGGPNNFNIWLNEKNYFATKINALLAINQNYEVTGAVTDAQDLGRLLSALAENRLVSQKSSEVIKELLLQSPFTDKYPVNGMNVVERRYEISTNDENPSQQYYTSILETENTSYIVVILVNNSNLSDEEVYEISSVLQALMTQAIGEEITENDSEIEDTEDFNASAEDDLTSPATPLTGAGSGEFYLQPVVGLEEMILLPDRAYQDANGNWIEPTWYYNADEDRYYYE